VTTTTAPAAIVIPPPGAPAGYLPGIARRASTLTVDQLRATLAGLPATAPVLLRFRGRDGLREMPVVLVDWDGALTLESEHCGPGDGEDAAGEQRTDDTDPAWLRVAEQEHDRAREQKLQKQADEVNQLLADLGITPISPARPGADGLISAHLVAVDPERELWGIDAVHDGQSVVLEAENWAFDGDYRTGPALTAATDVVPLRRHGVPGLDS
jgi:hypothetical protein